MIPRLILLNNFNISKIIVLLFFVKLFLGYFDFISVNIL
jgi:hypothetical protein